MQYKTECGYENNEISPSCKSIPVRNRSQSQTDLKNKIIPKNRDCLTKQTFFTGLKKLIGNFLCVR
jgi:hypothetical protein